MSLSRPIPAAILALVLLAGAAPLSGQAPAAPVKSKANRTKTDRPAIAEKYSRFMGQGIFARLAATPISIEGRYLALLDGQSKLSPETLESIRMNLQNNLGLPVRLAPIAADDPFSAGLEVLHRDPTNIFAAVLLVAQTTARLPALTVATDNRIVVLNITSLSPSDQLPLRIEKQAMRGIGLVYGLALAGDPFSVMRPLGKGIGDLDTFGRTFSPNESQSFNQSAESRGFPIRLNTLYLDKVVNGLMPPINPARWPAWEKMHKKSVAETFKKYGFNPDEIAAEYKRLIREGLADPEDAAEAKAKP